MSSNEEYQADFKAVPQHENQVQINDELSSKTSIEQPQTNQDPPFSCKQFLFGSQKRTILSVCFMIFSLLGVAGFIVGMLIISGDIKIQSHQIITGFDGKQYNYTNLQVKPEWSLQYNDFVVLQLVADKSRLLQEVQIEQACFFFDSPDELITIQHCNNERSIILNEDKVNKLIQELTQKHGRTRILQSDMDQVVDFDQFLKEQIKINGEIPEITSDEFVEFDSEGNLISDPDNNRRLLFSLGGLFKPIAEIATNIINNSINQGLQIAQNAAQTIMQGVVSQVTSSITSGICKGNKPGPVTVLKNCIPSNRGPIRRFYRPGPVLQCTPSVIPIIIPKVNPIPIPVIPRRIPFGRICPRII